MIDVGCQLLGSLLSSSEFSPLRRLFLIGPDYSTSIVAFATDVLKHLPALEILSLQADRIGDDEAAALASALQHLSPLQRLDLDMNQLSDSGLFSFR